MKKTCAISDIGTLVEGNENNALLKAFQCLQKDQKKTVTGQNPTEARVDGE